MDILKNRGIMSLSQSLYDWLGRRLNAEEVSSVASSAAVANATASVQWMELARQICVGYVSAAVQKCEIRFVGADGKRDELSEYLWNINPNPNQSAAELVDFLVWQMFTRGEAVVLPWRSGSDVTLWNADEWTVEAKEFPTAPDHFTGVSIGGVATERDWWAGQLYRFNADCTPDHRFTALQKAVDGAYARLAQSAAAAYQNGNVKRYKWKRVATPSGDADKQRAEQEQMLKAVKQFATADGTAAVFPEYAGNELSNFDQTGQTANTSTDFINLRKDAFETAAACMRMPTSMMYGNINSFESVFQSFITFAIDPVAFAIANELTRKTYSREEWAKGAHAEVDTSTVRHEDLYDAASKIYRLTGNRGVLTPDEVRADFGRDALDPETARIYLNAGSEQSAGGDLSE